MSRYALGVIKEGLKHSSAQGLLIFSGILVIFSIWSHSPPSIVATSFFTLFYAIIVHSLTSLRKHESLGKYFVGDSKIQTLWFTVSYFMFLAWWSVGAWALLSRPIGLNKICNKFDAVVSGVPLLLLFLALFFTLLLFCGFFYRLLNSGTYEVLRYCRNCDWSGKIKIPKGTKFKDHPCQECGVSALRRSRHGHAYNHTERKNTDSGGLTG